MDKLEDPSVYTIYWSQSMSDINNHPFIVSLSAAVSTIYY